MKQETTTTTTTTTIYLETLLKWSAPKQVNTRAGLRNLQTAQPSEAFWAAWRAGKEQLKAAGISVGQRNGCWEVCWWQPVEPIIASQVEESRAVDADIVIPAPDGFVYRPFQRAGIKFAMGRKGTLIGDDMGLGKTIQAIGRVNADPNIKRVLVITKARLKANWKRELGLWLVRPMSVAIAEAKFWPVSDVVIINFDILYKHRAVLTQTQWDAVIIDEAHSIKNTKARRTKCVLGEKREKIPGIEGGVKLALTGTPIENRPADLWPVLNWLDGKSWGSFFSFARRYCDAKQTRFGWDFSGHSNTGELNNILRSSIMVRRLKTEVLTELPPKQRQVIEMDVDENSAGAVADENALSTSTEEALAKLQVELELAETAEQYAEIVSKLREAKQVAFTEMAKVRHNTAVAKTPAVIEHIRDFLEETTEKLIVFAHHHDVLNAIYSAFQDQAVLMSGETDIKKGVEAEKAFMTDPKIRLFVGSIRATGEGLNLTAATTVMFAELDWVPSKVSQCEDRAHRIGQKGSVLIQHLVVNGSFDSKMAKTIVRKQAIADAVLDTRQELPATAPEAEGDSLTVVTIINAASGTTEAGKGGFKPQPTPPPAEACAIYYRALQTLAGVCNGAATWDGAGFSKIDVEIGHKLASNPNWTPRQAWLAIKIGWKYRKQLASYGIELPVVTKVE